MSKKKGTSENIMEKLAAVIVDRRKAFLVIFLVLMVYAAASISKVKVNNELTDYLDTSTETRQGVDIMDSEFTTFGSASVLVANITYEKALDLAHTLEEIRGISAVDFYDPDDENYEDKQLEDDYKDASALFTLTFEEPEDTPLSQQAIARVRSELTNYDAYVYTTVDKDDSANLQKDMQVILVIAVFIIVAVLLFTSKTYIEIVIFMLTFATAALLNMGTNYWFVEVSFITNAVCTVLQLAMAIDYAIILFHRYMEEKESAPTREALVTALSKAIPEISSSSLTTVSGMVALLFMQFGIGPDLGRAMVKAILISLLTVFCFMPGLIYMFDPLIGKTMHKSFVPKIDLWGKWIVKTRYLLLPVFLVVIIFCAYFSSQCPYIYDMNSVEAEKLDEYLTSKARIEQTFRLDNNMALILPAGDYQKEAQVIAQLEQIPEVDSVTGLANIEVDKDNGYTLVDSLRPREFAETTGLDVGLAETLYRFYAIDQEKYGALLGDLSEYQVPIVSMIDFIYDQKENRGLQLDEELSQDVDDIYKDVCDAREQLEGSQHTRIVFSLDTPIESAETFQLIDQIRSIAQSCYVGYENDIFVVGDSTSAYDLSKSFEQDNTLISVLTVLFVGIILLFTFQSASLPFMLCLTIQGSIWINFSLPYFTGSTMFFLSYLVVSSIQMGATIDYAIVITSRYMALRETMKDRKQAIVEALNQAFPTVVTSGTILCSAGILVGKISSNAAIASLGSALGSGTLISIILVMTILPQILLLGDKMIEKTSFALPHTQVESGPNMLAKQVRTQVDGHITGWFCGQIDAQITGTLCGDMDLVLKSGKWEPGDVEPDKEITYEIQNDQE